MTDRLIPSETPIGDELAVSRAKAGQPPIVPARQRDRGVGPFKRLVLRGATVIDGTGAPPIGPTDIVIENNRITLMKKAVGNLATSANRVPAGDHLLVIAAVEDVVYVAESGDPLVRFRGRYPVL